MTNIPTDRPLTAGDVPMLREGDKLRLQMAAGPSDRAGDLFEFEGGCPAHQDRIRVRPVGSRAFYAWHPSRFTFVRRPAASDEGVGELVNELRLAACGFFTLKNDRGDYGYFDTLADRIAALASPPVSERERELERQIEILRRASEIPTPDDDTDFSIDKAKRGAESWRSMARNTVAAYDALTAQPAGEPTHG